jgi:hypothetical protein
MFGIFKKKAAEQIPATQEIQLNPAYDNFVARESISNLKLNMINALATIAPPQMLSQLEKQCAIQSIMAGLPERVKIAVESSNKLLYVFGTDISSIPYGIKMTTYGGVDKVFEQIVDDLFLIFRRIGLKPELTKSRSGIILNTATLLTFCNFEKLAALKG